MVRTTVSDKKCKKSYMENGRLIIGCSSMPAPNGDEGEEWCRVDLESAIYKSEPFKGWDFCKDELDYDSLR